MPINPYQNQMQTMQAQNIPQGGLPGTPAPTPPPATTPTPPPTGNGAPPAGNAPPAGGNGGLGNAVGNYGPLAAIMQARGAFRDARRDWRSQMPQFDPSAQMDPGQMRDAMVAWRQARPSFRSYMMPGSPAPGQPNPAAVSGFAPGAPIPGANG